MKIPLYEVWCSHGTGMVAGPRFRYLDDALRYVETHRDGTSMAIRNPEGEWEMVAARSRQTSSRSVQASRGNASRG